MIKVALVLTMLLPFSVVAKAGAPEDKVLAIILILIICDMLREEFRRV